MALVQSKGAGAFSGTSIDVVLTDAVTSGNIFGGIVVWGPSTVTLTGITDTRGNTYTLLHNPTTEGSVGFRGALFYAPIDSSGTCTVTCSFSANTNYITCGVHEISETTLFDTSTMQAQTDPGTGTDAVSSGAITPSVSGCYLFGGSADGTNLVVPSAGTGWTGRLNGPVGLRTEELIQGTAQSVAAVFTGGNSLSDFVSGIIAFKAAGGGGGGNPWHYYAQQ